MTIRFDAALDHLIRWLSARIDLLPKCDVALVRDLRGQIRLVADNAQEKSWTPSLEAEVTELLGSYKSQGKFFIYLGRDQGFDSFFKAPDAYACAELPQNWVVLDRLVTGREWLYPANAPANHPPRFVFYGLKGGVGRSTALSMVAWHLAQQGKKNFNS